MSEERGFTVRDRRRVRPDAATSGDAGAEAPKGEGKPRTSLPPVDFTGFVVGLAQMALVHLGEVADPATGEVRADLEQARHTIDILDMLQEKTRGNLTPDEATLLRTVSADLKLKFVRASRGRD
ncbi:MAG: DUF1844 domain-containing protein [Deltaproteobacteria bacterium]|nr:DUF1844 domain-containing protein [Deltaproteobacteria bacterium]